jgi:hypothetical protein
MYSKLVRACVSVFVCLSVVLSFVFLFVLSVVSLVSVSTFCPVVFLPDRNSEGILDIQW